jgi:hypothetical protein
VVEVEDVLEKDEDDEAEATARAAVITRSENTRIVPVDAAGAAVAAMVLLFFFLLCAMLLLLLLLPPPSLSRGSRRPSRRCCLELCRIVALTVSVLVTTDIPHPNIKWVMKLVAENSVKWWYRARTVAIEGLGPRRLTFSFVDCRCLTARTEHIDTVLVHCISKLQYCPYLNRRATRPDPTRFEAAKVRTDVGKPRTILFRRRDDDDDDDEGFGAEDGTAGSSPADANRGRGTLLLLVLLLRVRRRWRRRRR